VRAAMVAKQQLTSLSKCFLGFEPLQRARGFVLYSTGQMHDYFTESDTVYTGLGRKARTPGLAYATRLFARKVRHLHPPPSTPCKVVFHTFTTHLLTSATKIPHILRRGRAIFHHHHHQVAVSCWAQVGWGLDFGEDHVRPLSEHLDNRASRQYISIKVHVHT